MPAPGLLVAQKEERGRFCAGSAAGLCHDGSDSADADSKARMIRFRPTAGRPLPRPSPSADSGAWRRPPMPRTAHGMCWGCPRIRRPTSRRWSDSWPSRPWDKSHPTARTSEGYPPRAAGVAPGGPRLEGLPQLVVARPLVLLGGIVRRQWHELQTVLAIQRRTLVLHVLGVDDAIVQDEVVPREVERQEQQPRLERLGRQVAAEPLLRRWTPARPATVGAMSRWLVHSWLSWAVGNSRGLEIIKGVLSSSTVMRSPWPTG